MATGLPTKANWAAGDVLTASQMDDLAGTVNLFQNSAYPILAGKNALINGAFDIWQRGTTGTATGYLADRWYNYLTGSGTFSQETSVIPANSKYALKFTASGSSQVSPYQVIETVNSLPYAGKTITLSAQVAASTSTPMTLQVQYSTTVDAPQTSGTWVTITATSGGTATPTSTTYVTISGVYAIPSNAQSIRVGCYNTSNIAAGVSIYYGTFQFELGSVATTFARNASTLQGELAACQRYYYRVNWNPQGNYGVLAFGAASSATAAKLGVNFPVEMRKQATSLDVPSTLANNQLFSYDDTGYTPTAITADGNLGTTQVGWVNVTVASGLTANRPMYLRGNNTTTAFLGFNAEL